MNQFYKNCQTLIFFKRLQFLNYFVLFYCNFSFCCGTVNGFLKRQGFCLPVNACTGKGRAEKGAEPFNGKEEELALSFFSVFFSDTLREGTCSIAFQILLELS